MKDIKKTCQATENKAKEIKAADEYPGVAINDADNDKDTEKLQRERTRTLNNNPRNDL